MGTPLPIFDRKRADPHVSGLWRLFLLTRSILTRGAASGAWFLACNLCALGAGISIPAIEVNGVLRPLPSATLVTVPEASGNVAFWLSSGAGTEPAAKRLRYRLEGVDSGWRDPASEMKVILQTQLDGGSVVNGTRQAVRGESPGWEGNPATAPWTSRTLELVVTEAASHVRVTFTSADFKGNANTLGFVAADRVRLRLQRPGQPPRTVDVPQETGEQMERPLGTPDAWTRQGENRGIARILWRSEPENRPVLLLDDRDLKGSAGWSSKPVPLEVEPGDRLTLEWRTAYSVGAGGECVTENYSRLSAGKYTLRVAATDTRGAPIGEETKLILLIQPPLAQRTSFWMAIAGLGGSVLAWASRRRLQCLFQSRRAPSGNAQIPAQKQARSMRGIQDELGATLTQVAILSTLEDRAPAKADESGQSATDRSESSPTDPRLADDLAWAINPANDTLEHFVEYLCEFANAALNTAGIRFLLEAPAILPDGRLNSNQRHQLFLAAKEALYSAVQSGGTSEVRLRIQVVGSQLRLQIEDNSRGLPSQSTPSAAGRMESHMDRVGGSVSRLNRPGVGSCVELSLRVRFP